MRKDNENIIKRTSPIVHAGRLGSVILDRGQLTQAFPAHNGNYIFSEAGAGVKPIVMIATMQEILEFLAENRLECIENRIEELPEIYMGISKYKAVKRFDGLFPVQDAVKQIVTKLATGLASPIAGEIAVGVTGSVPAAWGIARQVRTTLSKANDVYGFAKKSNFQVDQVIHPSGEAKISPIEKACLRFRDFHRKHSSSGKKAVPAEKAYLKFHYLRDAGMTLIGRGQIPFKDVYKIITGLTLPAKETTV